MENFIEATCAASVYETTAWHNALTVNCTMQVQGKTRRDAFLLLHSTVMVSCRGKEADADGSRIAAAGSQPDAVAAGGSGGGAHVRVDAGGSSRPRGPTATGLAPRVSHKYLSLGINYFYSAMASTAVRVFLKRLEELTSSCVTNPVTPDGTRVSITVPPGEAQRLTAGHVFLYEVGPFEATRDATAAVFKRFGAHQRFIKAGASGGKPVLVCLLAHLAIVATKIDEYLKRVGGVKVVSRPGIIPGHRTPWRDMLRALDTSLTQRGHAVNCLRLLDGDRSARAHAHDDSAGAGVLALFGHWVDVEEENSGD